MTGRVYAAFSMRNKPSVMKVMLRMVVSGFSLGMVYTKGGVEVREP